MFNLDPPPGFRGLHPDEPLTVYQRHLPHWRQDGATYFATFRLADSLPPSRSHEISQLKENWERFNKPPHTLDQLAELNDIIFQREDEWLDSGIGSCHLRDPLLANFVTEAMHFFDNDRYELNCYVVMPTHVHSILRPLHPDEHALEDILHSWKIRASRQINQILERSGNLWQGESHDSIMRNEQHLYYTIQYTGNNPEKAGLAPGSCPIWIRPEWEQLGWGFR